MDAHRRGRWIVWPFLLPMVLMVGMILGFNLRDSLRNKRKLDEVIDLIKDKYVDTISNNVLYKDAFSGILRSLDPHTVYIPADELQEVNDDLDGGFSGIGVEFAIVRDTIGVTNVIENGPSAHAGVEIGDQLIKVGDSLVAGINITADRIIHLLKGKQRSDVYVTVKRQSNGILKKFPITRDIIPTYSVEASIMLDKETGFIKINRFSATTIDEFNAALKRLIAQGAKQLILDLRDNPGGYLDAATAIADNFLDDNKLIVYTKGLHTQKTEYRASQKGTFENGRLAILIDEGSASASEILAGAIQDWDRGIIIGRRSFGKGLVQKQYDLQDGGALRLTVAKYYTPSGRCIQRSFAKGRDAYMEDYEKRFESGELTGNDSVATVDTTPFYTSNHRVVFGGGGIKPDIYIPYDTTRMSSGMLSIIYSKELKAAIWDYFIRNKAAPKYKSIDEFNTSFNGQGLIKAGYLSMLEPEVRNHIAYQLSKPSCDNYFRVQVKAQLARFLFRDNGYYAISLKDDEAVNKALAVLGSAAYLKLINGK